ncbi:MAG: transporter [Terrimonas sp.]|nr:transporter [Terrimonas sp.]
MVKFIISCFFASLPMQFLSAQVNGQLSLTEAYALAREHYPVTQQSKLIEQTAAINISNLSRGFLPQVNLSAQATYQSDVTKVSIPLPGFSIDPLSKDQYKVVAEVNQLIFDGGVLRQQKAMQQLNADVEEQQVQVELYQLKDRINQIYLGILYLDEQLKQVDLVKADIQTGIKRVEAQVQNGVAFRSNLNVLKAEWLRADQRNIELQATRKGLLATLGLFLGQPLPENIRLLTPRVENFTLQTTFERPELRLFEKQSTLLSQQNKLIRSRNLPRASLFFQSGYGRPGLNMLKNDFDFFYIGGVRLNWALANLYTKRKEKELVTVNQKMVDIRKETFLLNTHSQQLQQSAEVEKMQQLLAADEGIIDLREQVKNAAKAQLENGVITANDYIREVNAEDQARQTRITHQLQLLQAQINYQTISGKTNE